MKYKYDHESLQIMHEEMLDFHRSGFISDARLREIEDIIFGEEDETAPEAETSEKEEEIATT